MARATSGRARVFAGKQEMREKAEKAEVQEEIKEGKTMAKAKVLKGDVVLLFPYGESSPDSIRVIKDDGRDWDALFDAFYVLEQTQIGEYPNIDEFLAEKGVVVLSVTKRISLSS